MPLEPYLLLSLADHPSASLALQQGPAAGAVLGHLVRCLNKAGRWAVHGTAPSPLLVWPAAHAGAAQAAAERASRSHGRTVEVLSSSDAAWVEGREIHLFTEGDAPALDGAAAQSEGKTRRLRTEAEKLAAYCFVVRAASTATDQQAFAEVSRAASKALRAKFGGGSITSAFAWLASAAGQTALQSVLAGEAELSGPLSLQQVAAAVTLAQEAERLRAKS